MSAQTDQRTVALRFLLGGVSCCVASASMHWMDTIKVRLQLDNELSGKRNIFRDRYYRGIVRGVYRVVQEEGFRALYQGLAASMIRELTYSSIRAGLYEPIKYQLGGFDKNEDSVFLKVLAGALSGLVGSSFTTPTDIVKVRLQADGHNKTKRLYKGTLDCVLKVYRQQGLQGFFTGATPNMARAVCLSCAHFPAYDHTKYLIRKHDLLQEGITLHFTCGMVSGFFCAVAANPADVVKTRIMNHRPEERKYVSPVDVFIKTVKSEGPVALFKGLAASWMRLGPAATISFIVLEKLRYLCGVNPI